MMTVVYYACVAGVQMLTDDEIERMLYIGKKIDGDFLRISSV